MQSPKSSGPALLLRILPFPGVSKVKREGLALLRVSCWQRLHAAEDDLTSSGLLSLLCSAALLGK